jgi:hypothetical protein
VTWLPQVVKTTIYRYALPPEAFERLDDAGMYVSRRSVTPVNINAITDLAAALLDAKVELRPLDSLKPIRGAWDSTLHASGIRLRNAAGWE